MVTAVETNEYSLLHQKIDYLTEQMEAQQRRQAELDELKADLIPIANHLVSLSIDELAEVGTEFQLEDLLFLLKRVLRNTEALLSLMDMLEAGMGMTDEINLLGTQVFSNMVETADRLERQGYFAFMREGWGVFEQIVAEFNDEDVRALGDNIVSILTTVRNMTQPEVMTLANNAISAIQPAEELDDISTLQLLRSLGDPQVRKGMARLLNIVKTLASDPADPSVN